MNTDSQRPRRRPFLRLAVIVTAFGAICAIAVAAFNLGAAHSAGTAVVALLIYAVPAAVFDWPRITLSDVFELLSAAVGALVEFIKSLFDW